MKKKVVFIVLYFLLLLAWLLLAVGDKFHIPVFMSPEKMNFVSALLLGFCLLVGWGSYIKRKEKFRLVLMLMASALALIYFMLRV